MKLKLLVFIFLAHLSLNSSTVFGQLCSSGGGGFTITPTVGCVGEQVTIKNQILDGKNIKYDYNFDRQQAGFPNKTDETDDLFFVY
jgi:hypothetical protein